MTFFKTAFTTASIAKVAAAAFVGLTLVAAAAPASAVSPPVSGPGYGNPGYLNKVVYTPRHGLRSCRRLKRLAFHHGSPWARRQYYRHCAVRYTNGNPFIAHARMCRRLYRAAYIHGSHRAAHKFARRCARYQTRVSYRMCRRWQIMAQVDGHYRAGRLFRLNCRFGG